MGKEAKLLSRKGWKKRQIKHSDIRKERRREGPERRQADDRLYLQDGEKRARLYIVVFEESTIKRWLDLGYVDC